MTDQSESREYHDPATSYLEIYDRWMTPRKYVVFAVLSLASAAVDFAGMGTYYIISPTVNGVLSTFVGLALLSLAYWEVKVEA